VRKQSETECDMRSTNLINCLSIRHRIRTNTCFVAPIDFYDMESNNCTFSFSVLRTPSNFITDPSVPCMCGYVCMYGVCVGFLAHVLLFLLMAVIFILLLLLFVGGRRKNTR